MAYYASSDGPYSWKFKTSNTKDFIFSTLLVIVFILRICDKKAHGKLQIQVENCTKVYKAIMHAHFALQVMLHYVL